MRITDQERGFIREVHHDVIIVQTTNDRTNFSVPRKMVSEGAGIIQVPGGVVTKGWHGTLIHYEGGIFGFMPDQGGTGGM